MIGYDHRPPAAGPVLGLPARPDAAASPPTRRSTSSSLSSTRRATVERDCRVRHRPVRRAAPPSRSLERLVRLLGRWPRAPDTRCPGLGAARRGDERALARLVDAPVRAAVDRSLGRGVPRPRRSRPHADALAATDVTWQLRGAGRRLRPAGRRAARQRGAGPERFVGDRACPAPPTWSSRCSAVLRAGAAYLPLDPAFPADRIALMLADAAPGGGPRRHRRRGRAGPGRRRGPRAPVRPARPGRARPTSSTPPARPGGPRAWWYPRRARQLPRRHRRGRAAGRRRPAARRHHCRSTSPCWSCSCRCAPAARVVLASGAEVRDPALLRGCSPQRITRHAGHPVAVAALLEASDVASPACGPWSAARRCRRRSAAELHRRARSVTNLYGPTEITVWATAAPSAATAGSPIGAADPGTPAYVLDAALRPVPPGVAGELYLGGAGVARGYLGRPGADRRRFVAARSDRRRACTAPATWCAGAATGDLEYLGRADHQVKVRGFRIELGEIEAVLAAPPGGERRAVVAVARRRPPGRVRGADERRARPPTLAAVRRRPAARATWCPAAIVVLDALPLTPNGKVDRAALPDPGSPRGRRGPRAAAARSCSCELFAEVLGVPAVGVDDDSSPSAGIRCCPSGWWPGPRGDSAWTSRSRTCSRHRRSPGWPAGSPVTCRPVTPSHRCVTLHPGGGRAAAVLPAAGQRPGVAVRRAQAVPAGGGTADRPAVAAAEPCRGPAGDAGRPRGRVRRAGRGGRPGRAGAVARLVLRGRRGARSWRRGWWPPAGTSRSSACSTRTCPFRRPWPGTGTGRRRSRRCCRSSASTCRRRRCRPWRTR